MKKSIQKILMRLPEFIFIYGLAYIIVRLTIQDRYPLGRIVFYAPLVPLILACLLAGIGCLLRRKRRWLVFAFVPVLVVLVVFAGSEYSFKSVENSEGGDCVKVLCWNVFHGILGWEPILDEMHALDPDIILVSEAIGEDYSDAPDFWKKNFPGYEVSDDSGWSDFVLLVRGRIFYTRRFYRKGLYFLAAEVEVRGRRALIVFPHLAANPFRDSERIYEIFYEELAEERDDLPMIISGDLNTPRSSRYMSRLRERYTSAFEAGGEGFAYSWLLPLPGWAIDHTFVNDGFEVVSYRTIKKFLSDHAAQEIILRFKD